MLDGRAARRARRPWHRAVGRVPAPDLRAGCDREHGRPDLAGDAGPRRRRPVLRYRRRRVPDADHQPAVRGGRRDLGRHRHRLRGLRVRLRLHVRRRRARRHAITTSERAGATIVDRVLDGPQAGCDRRATSCAPRRRTTGVGRGSRTSTSPTASARTAPRCPWWAPTSATSSTTRSCSRRAWCWCSSRSSGTTATAGFRAEEIVAVTDDGLRAAERAATEARVAEGLARCLDEMARRRRRRARARARGERPVRVRGDAPLARGDAPVRAGLRRRPRDRSRPPAEHHRLSACPPTSRRRSCTR